MSNLFVRIFFAVFAIPLFLFALWFDYKARASLLTFMMTVGAWEYGRMVRKQFKVQWAHIWMPLLVLLLGLLISTPNMEKHIYPWIIISIFASIIASFKFESEKVFPTFVATVFGPMFFGLWMSFSYNLINSADGFAGAYQFMFVAVAMWVCDSGAYFAGRALGKNKLAPKISPKKTIEGSVGGLVLTIVFAIIAGKYWLPELGIEKHILLGLLMGITAQIGDLLMSAVKRHTGVKDSSQIFPGHGGMIDRFDSFFLSAPTFAIILHYLGL